MRAKQYAKRALSLAAAAVLTVTSVSMFTPAKAEQVEAKPQYPFMDTTLTFEERAADLVSRLTLDEKVNQLGRNTVAVPRLGLAKYDYWNEALHGIQNGTGEGTSYPMPLSLAQTWDTDFISLVATNIADEARGHSQPTSEGGRGRGLTYWCPTVNLGRSPLWGRTNEAYGEDAYVSGVLAAAFANGMQGEEDSKYYKTVATIKHYALNEHENGRGSTTSDTSEANIRDYYTKVYRYIIEFMNETDKPLGSLMSAYNAVNSTPSSANTFLLTTLLRQTFGFTGFVTSDCGAIGNLEGSMAWEPAKGMSYSTTEGDGNYTLKNGNTLQDYLKTDAGQENKASKEGSIALALMAGCDMDCGGEYYPARAKAAVQAGILDESQVDINVYNNLLARFKLGEFDPDEMVSYASDAYSFANTVETDEHRELANEAAARSGVLLKNDGILPLDASKLTNIVVVGDNADVCWTGNYSGKPQQKNLVSIYAGIDDYMFQNNRAANVEKITSFNDDGTIKDADKKTIEDADIVIMFGSDVHDDSSEGHDRDAMVLTRNQPTTIASVAELNENVILYLQTSNIVEVEDFENDMRAIIWTSQNGQAQGYGAAQQLFGEVNMNGKLTFTWYEREDDIPGIRQYGLNAEQEGDKDITNFPTNKTQFYNENGYDKGGFTYQYFKENEAVSYPFGYGLSYTTYAYSNVKVDKTTVDANGKITVSVDVENTGKMDGSEVVQVYVAYPQASNVPEGLQKQIKGFAKVDLAVGEKKTANIELDVSDFTFWDETTEKQIVPTGEYTIQVGASSRDIKGSKKVTVTGALADEVNVLTANNSGVAVKVGGTLTTNVKATLKNDSFLDLSKATVTYTSQNTAVATVDNKGVVTGKADGVTTIEVKVVYNGKTTTTTFPVAVRGTAQASSIKVNGSAIANFDPATTLYNVEVKDGKVPTVTADGATVTAATSVPGATTVKVTKGTETMTYTINFVDACDITAVTFGHEEKVSTAQAAAGVNVNAQATTKTCEQAAHASKAVTFTYAVIDDQTTAPGATVNASGVVKATGEGRVTVEVTAVYNGAKYYATTQILVSDAVDRSKLEEAIRVKVTGNDYEEESLNNYYAQIDLARAVFFDKNATQEEIDKAYEDLMAVKKLLVDYSYVVASFPDANKSYSMGGSNNIYINWEKVKDADGKDTTADLTTHDSSKLELRFTITLTPSSYDTSFSEAINSTGNWFKLRSTDNASKDFDPHKTEFGGPEDTNNEHNFGWAVSDYIKDWGTTEVVIPLEVDPADGVEGHDAGLPVVSRNFCGDNKDSGNLMDQTKYTSRGIIDWSQLDRFFGIINFKSSFAASNTVSAKLENVRVVDRTFEEESEKLTAELDKNVDIASCSDSAKVEAYNNAVAVAKEALAGNNALAIMKANTALVEARDALGVTVTVNKEALQAAYDARLTDEDNILETSTTYKRYTDASWAAYQQIVTAANALLQNTDADQLSVNKVTTQLKNADSILQLTKVSSYVVATLLAGEKTVEAHHLSVVANADLDLSKDKDHTVTVRYDIKLESTWTDPAPLNEGWLKLVRNGKVRFWSAETPNNDNPAATQYDMNCEKNSVMTTYGPSGSWMTIIQEVPAEVLEAGKLTRFEVFMYNDTESYQAPADEGIVWDNDTGVKMTVRNIQVMSDLPRDEIPLDTIPLETAIGEAEGKNLKVYTESSAQALTDAVTAAKAVMAKDNKTQKEINDAKKVLDDALANLKLKREGDSTDTVTFSASNGIQTTLQDGTQFYVDWKSGDGLSNDDVDGNGADLSGTAANGASKELALRMNIRYGLVAGAEGDPANCWKMLFLRLRSGRIGGNERACKAIVLYPSDVTAKADGSYDIEIPLSDFVTENIDWTDVRQLIIRSELNDESGKVPGQRVDSKTYTMTVTDARIESMNDIPVVPVDKAALNTAINAAKAIDTEEYTDESVVAFTEALTAAERVAANTAATQTEVDTATTNLTNAQNALVKKVQIDYGNVNGKEGVTAEDALLALQIATGKITPTTEQLVIANVDGSEDGKVSANDALLILQYSTKKISVFPVVEQANK